MSGEVNRLLALSGGGYRAMLFHVGALWRLNDLGELSRLSHVSSVSGGSIIAGVLAAGWNDIQFDECGVGRRFAEVVAEPLLRLASHTIDLPAAALGLILPFTSAAECLENAYAKALFGARTLGDLPAQPTFFFNATNCQSGAIWTFTRDSMGDPTLGTISSRRVPLAMAVAASSAFPPFLSPLRLLPKENEWQPYPCDSSTLRAYDDLSIRLDSIPSQELERYRKCVVLADGGIADNLGVAALWRKPGDLFIGDGGGSPRLVARPRRNWVAQLMRTVNLIHEQPSQLRAFAAISRFADHDERHLSDQARSARTDGAYWNMRWPPESHEDVQFPMLDKRIVTELAHLKTRLGALDSVTKKRLVNWGYVASNRSLPYVARLWSIKGSLTFEERLPFPDVSILAGSVSEPERGNRDSLSARGGATR